MPRDYAASTPRRRTSARRRPSSAPAPPPGAVAEVSVAVPDEGALGEIRHELGNFFHKLYYWIDRLDEGGDAPDAAVGRMLEQTVRNLEDFLGIALEYFGPLSVAPVPMAARDVLAGLRARVEGAATADGPPLDEGAGDGSRVLRLDPARLPEVLDAALRQLLAQAPAGTPVRLHAASTRREGTAGLSIELSLAGGAGRAPAFHSAAATLAWARARRVAALHGGALAEQTAADGGRAVALFLPYSD